MNTTESIYSSIMQEKSFIKHFKKGANSREGQWSRPPVLQTERPALADPPPHPPEQESTCNTRGENLAHWLSCNFRESRTVQIKASYRSNS